MSKAEKEFARKAFKSNLESYQFSRSLLYTQYREARDAWFKLKRSFLTGVYKARASYRKVQMLLRNIEKARRRRRLNSKAKLLRKGFGPKVNFAARKPATMWISPQLLFDAPLAEASFMVVSPSWGDTGNNWFLSADLSWRRQEDFSFEHKASKYPNRNFEKLEVRGDFNFGLDPDSFSEFNIFGGSDGHWSFERVIEHAENYKDIRIYPNIRCSNREDRHYTFVDQPVEGVVDIYHIWESFFYGNDPLERFCVCASAGVTNYPPDTPGRTTGTKLCLIHYRENPVPGQPPIDVGVRYLSNTVNDQATRGEIFQAFDVVVKKAKQGDYDIPFGTVTWAVAHDFLASDTPTPRHVVESLETAIRGRLTRLPYWDIELHLPERAVANWRPPRTLLLELLQGIRDLPSTARNVLLQARRLLDARLLKSNISSVKRGFKDMIGDYLTWMYAVRPVPSDVAAVKAALSPVIQDLQPLGHMFSRAEYVWDGWRGRQNFECAFLRQFINPLLDGDVTQNLLDTKQDIRAGSLIDPGLSDIDQMLNSLSDRSVPADFYSVIEELWAIVPLSFVVDWITDFDGTLTHYKNKVYYERLPVQFCCYSVAAERDFSDFVEDLISKLSLRDVNATLHCRYFNREYAKEAPEMNYDWKPSELSNHWLEGSALVIQRILR